MKMGCLLNVKEEITPKNCVRYCEPGLFNSANI